jgi:hypothetical protein
MLSFHPRIASLIGASPLNFDFYVNIDKLLAGIAEQRATSRQPFTVLNYGFRFAEWLMQ